MKLYGRNPVLERIKSNPRSILKIFVQAGHPESAYVHEKAKKYGIPVNVVPGSKMLKLARDVNSQGLLAEIEKFSYLPLPDVLEAAKKKNATLVFLDELNDPQNLGGIMRSLGCLGDFYIVLPTHHSVEVTETVLRVACGGDNYVGVSKVANIAIALAKAKEEGFWIAGSVVKDGQDLMETRFQFPLALVIGSEQKGIRDVIRKQLDLLVTIPMANARMSLNAAHATTILCYEILRQRKNDTSR
ncbi:MAG: 23S rRNA (guanosine(2251)-2'-O)-methyltransferase RlmB [Candidatus Omnitrophica bacterium]|nr:23S rRNA (guanosine(2251)-2'-O)-methyltransferase RlmB [Candidatus Omnitrophota bacterium]